MDSPWPRDDFEKFPSLNASSLPECLLEQRADSDGPEVSLLVMTLDFFSQNFFTIMEKTENIEKHDETRQQEKHWNIFLSIEILFWMYLMSVSNP